jgi:hemoglobin
MSKWIVRFKSMCIVVVCGIAVLGMAGTSLAQEKSLYQRLGGYDAVSAVVGEFADRLFVDQKLSPFFGGWNAEKQGRFKQLNVLLVCNATGGPCTYIGRTMTDSHQGMAVDDTRFDQVAGHLVATLVKFKVPEKEKKELLDIIGSLRGQIVEKK